MINCQNTPLTDKSGSPPQEGNFKSIKKDLDCINGVDVWIDTVNPLQRDNQ